MQTVGKHNYFVYITTNVNKTVLYVGVTNDLQRRLSEHLENIRTDYFRFSARYKTFHLVYWEHYTNIEEAIFREKQIKKWRREKKNELISEFNPNWTFFDNEI